MSEATIAFADRHPRIWAQFLLLHIVISLCALLLVGGVLIFGLPHMPPVPTIWFSAAAAGALFNVVRSFKLFEHPSRRHAIQVAIVAMTFLVSFALLTIFGGLEAFS